MAAAAALRFAARRVCGRAFQRPQAYFTTAASAALKEQQSRLLPLPGIGRGGSALRRFSSSESQNVLNNSKHLPTNNATNLIKEKKQELLHLLRQAEHPNCAMELEDQKLLHLLGQTPGPEPGSTIEFMKNHMFKVVTGTLAATAAVFYVETKYIFPLFMRVEQGPSSEKAK